MCVQYVMHMPTLMFMPTLKQTTYETQESLQRVPDVYISVAMNHLSTYSVAYFDVDTIGCTILQALSSFIGCLLQRRHEHPCGDLAIISPIIRSENQSIGLLKQYTARGVKFKVCSLTFKVFLNL